MKVENMFEFAIRNKFRFPFKGVISVEDLWDLSVENLDVIFKTLNSEIKQKQEESLLNIKTKEDEVLDIKIEIIKHIVSIKQKENEDRAKAKEKKMQKQKILAIMSEKKEADLYNKSPEELQAMLDELNN